MSIKNPLTPAGIEPATYRFVAQHLNHSSTAVPRFLVGTSRFVIGAMHRLATTWTMGLSGLRKTTKMPSELVGILEELRTGHLPNRSQNDAAGISYNIIKIFYFMRPQTVSLFKTGTVSVLKHESHDIHILSLKFRCSCRWYRCLLY